MTQPQDLTFLAELLGEEPQTPQTRETKTTGELFEQFINNTLGN